MGRSSTDGDRYERIKARNDRANPRVLGTADVAFTVPTEEAKRRLFVVTVLPRFRYSRLQKGQRGVLFAYMQRLTGYSRQHLSRLLTQYRNTKSLRPLERTSRTSFARKYSPAIVEVQEQVRRRLLHSFVRRGLRPTQSPRWPSRVNP